jgi:putative two-component system response regulator
MIDAKKRQTVLIVDDVPANIDILRYTLESTYDLKVAINGKRALDIAHKDPVPDLILLDIMMPDMDGYEVCKQLKSEIKTRKIPVIFVTAMGEVEDETQGFEVGAVDYITKPVSPPIVQQRVKTHLALYNQNKVLEQKVEERTVELLTTRLEIINRLGVAAEYKDEETGQHILRMSNICRIIAKGSGMNDEEVNLIYQAAPMHDVGKIGIPDKILLKPGKLDPEEWKIMKNHTLIGTEIIGNHPSEIMQAAGIIALTHHERWDGSGYPLGKKGKEIHIYGRIAAIADVFDALTSKRPYKEAWPIDKAIQEIIKLKGTYFDPILVDVFIENIQEVKGILSKYARK